MTRGRLIWISTGRRTRVHHGLATEPWKQPTMKTMRISPRLLALGVALAAIAIERAVSWWLGIERLAPGVEGVLAAWAIGHCDSLDGPVVTLARKALETGNVNLVLPWVRPADEPETRHALDHALAVRSLGPRARELADTHFFETLVRLHRASEGAPYTGLKPAGTDLGPVVPAAEQALETGLLKQLVSRLTEAVRSGVHRRFQAARARKQFAVDNVAAGRDFVAAYESYVHYVEQLWEVATADPTDHVHGPATASASTPPHTLH
jgi:hypothetical protein